MLSIRTGTTPSHPETKKQSANFWALPKAGGDDVEPKLPALQLAGDTEGHAGQEVPVQGQAGPGTGLTGYVIALYIGGIRPTTGALSAGGRFGAAGYRPGPMPR
jgi:hypothetical protein